MLLIDDKAYEFEPLPAIHFGHAKPLAYVINPKVASTHALNFIFYVNHGYRYYNPHIIYRSTYATVMLGGTELNPAALDLYLRLAPETFSIVRDPLRRFISGFLSKLLSEDDLIMEPVRDLLTSLHGIDLSPEADPARSCLALAEWIAAQEDVQRLDAHFRPQYLNLAAGSRFAVDTILRLEDRDAILAYYAKWVGEEKAKWFMSLRFNEQTKIKAEDCMSEALAALVRKIYAKDYELFYP
jgi:Sulfotransferase family